MRSMITVWKYILKPEKRQRIRCPCSAKILSAHEQNGQPAIWVQVDTDEPLIQEIDIFLVGTGQKVSIEVDKWTFIGTILLLDGDLVWHIYANDHRGSIK
jgi:hypothetical protein